MKVLIEDDCGNAPKRRAIADLLTLVAQGEDDGVMEFLTEDATWEVAGSGEHQGDDQIRGVLNRLTDPDATEFSLVNVLSHGAACAADGVFRRANGQEMAVAHFFRFSGHGKNAKINRVTSYIIC